MPGELGIGPLHRRDETSALEDLEPGGLQHALRDTGRGDVVQSFIALECAGGAVPAKYLEAPA
jgi:hypothetical protein